MMRSSPPPIVTLNIEAVQGTVSETLLSGISILDNYLYASTWNLRLVALVTTVLFGIIRKLYHKKYGVDWYAFIHAFVTGIGAIICMYLNFFASESLTGITEPLRTVLCHGPLTSLHRILPAITMGYALFDLVDGFSCGLDFILHGLATLSVMAYFCEYEICEFIVPMLLMEVSSIHLTMIRAEFFSTLGTTINMACFVLAFFTFRIVFVPIYWYYLIQDLFRERHTDDTFQSCLPWHTPYVCLIMGCFFHCLNAFWFYKIIQKVKRKIMGIEHLKANNHMEKTTTTTSVVPPVQQTKKVD